MNIWYKIFGHKWAKIDSYKQDCIRKRCLALRYLAYDKVKAAFCEKSINWEIINISKIKIK